ncbi:MAG: hypothetical protein LBR79_05000 [Oscillospiraceae bacterium]|jgi:hypothetical protein|nr:hypothetical protein [Oscillospiraceae bacterium]
MKKFFLKLIICNLILCFGMALLSGVRNCYAVRDDNPGISENNPGNVTGDAESNDFKVPDAVNDNNNDNKIDANENHLDTPKKTGNLESDHQNAKKPEENAETAAVKPAKKKTDSPKTQNEKENTQQALLPEISFEDLDLNRSEKTENLKQKDGSGKMLKGAISWVLILSGIALIIFVVADNRKIPGDADIKMRNKHSAKPKRKKYS